MWNKLTKIANECSEFIEQCNGLPALKTLRCNGEFVRRVKVRKKNNSKDEFIHNFNNAFDGMYNNLHGRSIFCNGTHLEPTANEELFYVLPINGFKYLFNPNVDYHREYQDIYNKMSNMMTHEECEKIFVDIIHYSYKESNVPLYEALLSEKEIIIYNVPYYYAVKVEKFPNYSTFMHEIKELKT